MNIFYKLLLLIFIFPLAAKADCDFRTGDYILELSKANKIKEIQITIPNSRKYFKELKNYLLDGFRATKKKKHKAIFNVKYEFGKCIYTGKVWQNGDADDHIKEYIRSLNVKLDNGNVFNATKFKLLIPESRNGRNEILGTLILRELGLISPETFEIAVNVNGINSIMLFQEDSRKELLERNKRREGPIFEGDESLFWGYGKYNPGELENISLSRMINQNWFLKNRSAEIISLNAFFKLQNAYLKYSNGSATAGNIIFPNKKENDEFIDYYFLMTVMNGIHALRPHNRKYYFNSFDQYFEPIYYDGDFYLIGDNNFEKTLSPHVIWKVFYYGYKYKDLSKLSDSKFENKIINNFKERISNFQNDDEIWINSRLKSISNSANNLQNLINKTPKNKFISHDFNYDLYRRKYLKALKNHGFIQNNINKISYKKNKYFVNNDLEFDKLEMSKIISRNKVNKKRLVFIPNAYLFKNNINFRRINLPSTKLDLNVYYSDGIKIKVNKIKKEILISQDESNDWILFKDSKIGNWKIDFKGVKANKKMKLNSRFNVNGLTGCLNFYNSDFKNTSITSYDGQCEDAINIISSYGSFKNIEISNGYADALDIDFSNIHIRDINVKRSTNDCIDLSFGEYNIRGGFLEQCGDKGISIGEKSIVKINNININKSLIGISVKDYSTAEVNQAYIINSNICVESKKKKEEFGGSLINLDFINCDSEFIKDKNSTIRINNNDI